MRWSSRPIPSISTATAPISAAAPPAIPPSSRRWTISPRAGSGSPSAPTSPTRLTHALLDALGWTDRFAAVVAGDSFPYRKPDPRLLHETIARAGGGRAAYVGDSIIDAETAQAAGIPFVAVSFGFSDRPASELGADAVIDDYADLIAALRSLA